MCKGPLPTLFIELRQSWTVPRCQTPTHNLDFVHPPWPNQTFSFTHSFHVFLPLPLSFVPQLIIHCKLILNNSYPYALHACNIVVIHDKIIFSAPFNLLILFAFIAYVSLSYAKTLWMQAFYIFTFKFKEPHLMVKIGANSLNPPPSTPHSYSWRFLGTTTLPQPVTQVTELVNQLQFISCA